MRGATGKTRMAPFEFQRAGPIARKPGGHKPDFTLSIKKPSQTKNRSARTADTPRRQRKIVADELFIVDTAGTSNFPGISEIECSGKKLNCVEPRVLELLTGCKKADFSDNSLPLEPFAVMPALEELDLSCNQLKTFDFKSSETMAGDSRAWKSLHTLNLSFNSCMKCITELTFIPFLTTLNLAHNNISVLPSNMMHFTCLITLNLAGNHLNSENTFTSLATIPSLQNLILDDNGIMHVPKFQFGFETLTTISLKSNKIELPDDIESLTDLEQLQTVDICKNPLVLRTKNLTLTRKIFQGANISLITQPGEAPKKQVLAGPLRTVTFDPLTLPTFTKQHIRALNKKRSSKMENVEEAVSRELLVSNPDPDLFITGFGSAADENEPDNELDIEATELPPDDEDEYVPCSIWNEVPVTGIEKRTRLTCKTKSSFDMAFRKLQWLVSHPDMRIKPRESPSTEPETPKEPAVPERSAMPAPVRRVTFVRKAPVADKLQARTEYTKSEIQNMLASMEDRLAVVERDLNVTDESGQSAMEAALEQGNFTCLHKQYEMIRAELINTLNG